MKSKGNYVLCVLMTIIAIPTVSVIVPHAFASIQPSDIVQIGTNPAVIIPETEEPSGLIPIGTVPDIPRLSTMIEFTDPNNPKVVSDILIYDPNGQICPQLPGAVTNICFESDDEQQGITVFPPVATIMDIPETGGMQDVGSTLLLSGVPVSVMSDVEPTPPIPEFPIPFSLVIIFVAVAAVYMGIRQKMMPGFKSF